MKKVIFTCLMCSFLTSVSALGQQKALIAEQWNVLEFRTIIGEQDFLDCRTYAYVLADDTIINNTNYQTIYRQKACDSLNTSELEFVGAIRQTEHQVYFYHNHSENLLYDFDVTIGDQRLIYAGINSTDETNNNVVTDVQFLADGRRVIYVEISAHETTSQEIWIEGIGAVSGILYTGPSLPGGYSSHLLCAYKDSELVYSTQNASFQPLGCCYNKEVQPVGAFYFPLNQEWKFLKEMYCDEGPKTEIEVITFDSTLVIAGKTYYSFRKFYFRSEGNKVFYHVSDDMPDVVLYDFDLQVGDSLTFFEEALPLYMIDPENPTYTVVTSIDTVTLMDGRQARRIHYDNRVDDIEYVGSVKGLLEPLRLPIATCMNISLLCVSINGEPIYAPSPDTAIPELLINTQSSKVFEDGQLIIINNGTRYNATGARVK